MAIVLMTAGDWECLNDAWHAAPEVLAGWTLVYFGAHVLLWWLFLRNRARSQQTPAGGAGDMLVGAGLTVGLSDKDDGRGDHETLELRPSA